MEEIFKMLLEEAKQASKNSYSPYSNFPVGACVLFESGETFKGANVENASYGLSLCAERNAISTGIASGIKSKIKAIAVYSPVQTKCMPCGACRQWLCELCTDNNQTKIILENDDGTPLVLSLNDIYPYGFKFEN